MWVIATVWLLGSSGGSVVVFVFVVIVLYIWGIVLFIIVVVLCLFSQVKIVIFIV